MAIDPAFDTPFPDYGQVGSYVSPVAVPSLGPLAGTLVSLPCINPDWLHLVLGCVDQLRNRSSWLASYTDAQIVAILGAVEQLRIALQMANPCCDVALQLTPGCVLQYSTDGGSTWTDVAGWAANFAACVQSAIIPLPPLLPPGSPDSVRACNIASFLSNEVIKAAITQAINAYDNNLSLLALAGNIAAITFAFDLPWTAAFIYGVYDLYAFFTAGNIADLRTAEADAVLWSDVTCAIYAAIKDDGKVTVGNCGAVISNICALAYTPAIAITAICAYVSQLGCNGLLSSQVAGALISGDCSGCAGGWCMDFDFTTGSHGWTVQNGVGMYAGASGFQSTIDVVHNLVGVEIAPAGFASTFINNVEVWGSTGQASDSPEPYLVYSSPLNGYTPGAATLSAGAIHDTAVLDRACTFIQVVIATHPAAAGFNYITRVKVTGTGVNPFGTSNC